MAYNAPPERDPRGPLAPPPPTGGLWGAPQAEEGSLAFPAGETPIPAPIVPPPVQGGGAPPSTPPPPPPSDLIGDIPPPPLPPDGSGEGLPPMGMPPPPLGGDAGMGMGMGMGPGAAPAMGAPAPTMGAPAPAPGPEQGGLLSPQDAAALLARMAAGRGAQ